MQENKLSRQKEILPLKSLISDKETSSLLSEDVKQQGLT
jgi:hypothetical protein